jgi:hypothetical protein
LSAKVELFFWFSAIFLYLSVLTKKINYYG